MKKLINLTLGILIFPMLFSCYDDDSPEKEESSLQGEIALITLKPPAEGRNGTTYTGQFLSFETEQDFINTYNQLEAAMDANAAHIRNVIGVVTDEDELDAKFAQFGLDEFKPLKDFENQYGLHSLRKEIKEQEETWLSLQGDEFDENDPDDHYIFDTVLRTLLNKDGEVMIAGKIVRNEEWGAVKISNMDTEAYYQRHPCNGTSGGNTEYEPFNRGNSCDYNADTGGGSGGGSGGGGSSCKVSSNHDRQYHTSTRRKMMTQVKLQRANVLYSNRFIARTRFFKRVAGIWFRKTADLYVKMEGHHQWSSDCNAMNYILRERADYAGEVQVIYVNPMPNGAQNDLAVKNNVLYSTHRLWGDNTKIMDFYDGNP